MLRSWSTVSGCRPLPWKGRLAQSSSALQHGWNNRTQQTEPKWWWTTRRATDVRRRPRAPRRSTTRTWQPVLNWTSWLQWWECWRKRCRVGERGAEPEGREGIPSKDQQFRGRSFFERLGDNDEPTVMVARGEDHMSQAWDLETREKPLDVHLARQLDFQAERLVPDAFQSLVTHGRAALFEVACGPDSLLTAKMRQLTGRDSSAERLSFLEWIWHDNESRGKSCDQ